MGVESRLSGEEAAGLPAPGSKESNTPPAEQIYVRADHGALTPNSHLEASELSQQGHFLPAVELPKERPSAILNTQNGGTQEGWPSMNHMLESSPMGTLSPSSTHSSHPGGRSIPPADQRKGGSFVASLTSSVMARAGESQPDNGSRHMDALGHPRGMSLQGDGGSSGGLESIEGIKYPHQEGGYAAVHPSERSGQQRGRMEGRGEGTMVRSGQHDDMGVMQRPGQRSLFPEGEAMGMYQASMMGQEAGFNRLSMQQGSMSGGGMDYRGERPLPMGRYGHRESPRAGMQGHMYSHSADENIYEGLPTFQEDLRESSAYRPLSPGATVSMHRSVSEGLMGRGGGMQPPASYHVGSEGMMQSSRPLSRDGGSMGGMQEEVNYNPRVSASAAAGRGPRMTDTPDFAMIYAFLGSMFDPVCHMINHADVMQQMNTVDRETTSLILANCVHNLGFPEFQDHLLQEGMRHPGPRARQAYGGGLGGGYGGQPPPGRASHQ